MGEYCRAASGKECASGLWIETMGVAGCNWVKCQAPDWSASFNAEDAAIFICFSLIGC